MIERKSTTCSQMAKSDVRAQVPGRLIISRCRDLSKTTTAPKHSLRNLKPALPANAGGGLQRASLWQRSKTGCLVLPPRKEIYNL